MTRLRHLKPPMLRRRAFLGSAGLATIGLPFLEGLPERSAWAQGNTPTFGLFIATMLGVVQGDWPDEPDDRFWPTELGPLTTDSMRAFADERCTGLLADYADRLLIIRGVNYPPFGISGDSHALGLVQCLTAAEPVGITHDATSSAPSVDTFIADALMGPGSEPLTLYAGAKGGFINERLSFSAAGVVRSAEGNPYAVYRQLMGLSSTPGGLSDRLLLRRKSVNDVVHEELNELLGRSELSQADRIRLEQHFDAIRNLEQRITDMATSCSDGKLDLEALEALNEGNAFRANGTIEEVAKLQFELAALAFACNAARVATLQIGDAYEQTRYIIDGAVTTSFSHISHRVASDSSIGPPIPEALEWHTAIDRIRMESFRHLLDRWSEYTTEAGSLLDHGFAMWTNTLAGGPSHSFRNLPYIIAGSGGGVLRQGSYIDAGDVSNDRLLNTLMYANGVPMAEAGRLGTGEFLDLMLA